MNNRDQYMEALTKREYFVGQALAGLCANERIVNQASDKANLKNQNDREAAVYFAEIAVSIADATLAELAKDKA